MKTTATLLTGLGLAALFAIAASAITPKAAPSIHDGSLADSNLRYIGRWDRSDPAVYHSHWGGAYMRVAFTGTSVAFNGNTTAGGANIMVSLDGEPLYEVPALHIHGLKAGTHTLLVGSPGQNFEIAFKGLTLDPDARTLATPERPILEFIGDSITTGGGQTLPSTVNYAWDSAEALGADHTQIAFSARALTTGYGCANDKAALDTQYFNLKNFNHLDDKPQTPWNFSYTPKIVVINLGQNDQCGQEPEDIFTANYVRFVQKIRTKFPRAQIVMLRPFSGAYEKNVRKAADLLTTDDKRVHFVDTTGWLEKPDFVDGIHPTQAGHEKVAQRLTPFLKTWLATE